MSAQNSEQPAFILDAFLEREGVVAALLQRIANLEQFRDLYLELAEKSDRNHAHSSTGNVEPHQSSNPDDENPDDENAQDTLSKLRQEVAQMSEVAFTAMRSNADLGGVIFLLTRTFECATTEELGKLVIETIGNYNLEGLVCFMHGGKREYFTTATATATEEDKNIIEQMPTDKILSEAQTYLTLYTPYCQLLIRQFDNSDMKAYNDLKDTLQMLVTGINAGVRRVISEVLASKERANLERLVMTTKKNLQNIEVKQVREVKEVNQIATAAITGIKNQLAKTNLEQDKKNQLILLLTQELAKIEKIIKEASLVDANFKKVINALTASISKQN